MKKSIQLYTQPNKKEKIRHSTYRAPRFSAHGLAQESPHLVEPEQEHILDLQQTLGNRVVQRLLIPDNIGASRNLDVISRQTKARTQDEARALVPAHVVPKACFIWYLNNTEGWGPIPGTGCAHWVAHQLGITNGTACNDGYSIRVSDVISGKESHPLREAQVGDLWVNAGASHVGIVRAVDTDERSGQVKRAQVEHDSSAKGGVVTTWFTSGNFFR